MVNIEFFEKIKTQLHEKDATLVAVSKTKPSSAILIFYNAGQRIFGENRVQELQEKYEILPKDIQWHLIGHLQSNKVKYIAPFVAMIHSIDSLKLLKEVNKQAAKNNRIIDCLLQFHIAKESTKFGLSLSEAKELLKSPQYAAMQHIRIVGVMGMATFTEKEAQLRTEFQQLKQIFNALKTQFFVETDDFKEISMGMSGDYELAVEEGSTMVRIGSKLFGSR